MGWQLEVESFMKGRGFTQSISDPCHWSKKGDRPDLDLDVGVFVDDFLMHPVKPCPNNCMMGQGTCSYIDVTGARLAARDCLAADWACSAVCVCGVGWHGDDCSLDEPAYAQVVELRSSLLGHLSTASSMQDVFAASLNQQASSLSSIAADPSELARGGELRALSLVGGIATSSEEIVTSFVILKPFFKLLCIHPKIPFYEVEQIFISQ